MAEPHIILDYASPRKRSHFRLASASLLQSDWEGATLLIRERLEGQAYALVVIIVSFLMLLLMVCTMLSEAMRLSQPAQLIFPAIPVVAWLAITPIVIHQTWRQTWLRIGDGAMRLSMGSPFGRRHYLRRFDQLHAIRVIPAQNREGAPLLAEIEILADDCAPIRLFTDHEERRLVLLAQQISFAIEGKSPVPEPNQMVEALRKVSG